jgi:hypothetical protein
VFSRSVWRWFVPSAVRLRADRWRRREAGDDRWRYRRKPASTSCGAGSQHWVDVLVNKRRLGSSTSAACPEPEQSRLPLRPTHSANTLNSASCTAVRGAPPLRKKVVSSQRTTKAKARRSHSLLLLTYSAPGGLRQDTGRAAESAARPRTDEDMGPRRACVVVDGRRAR